MRQAAPETGRCWGFLEGTATSVSAAIAPALWQWGGRKAKEELDLTAHRSRTRAGKGDKGASDANGKDGDDPANDADLRGCGRGNRGWTWRTRPRPWASSMNLERFCGMVPDPGPIQSGRGPLGCDAESSSRRLVGRSAARQRRRSHEATLVDDATQGLRWLQDARLGSDMHSSRLRETSGSAMSATTQEFVRRVANGKDSDLHPEAALRELLPDRAKNYGSSQCQVTLTPCQKRHVSIPRDRRSVKSRRWRALAAVPIWKGVGASSSQFTVSRPCFARSSGQRSFTRDLRSCGFVVFGRWCVDAAPYTSRLQWHLSAAFKNVIDICHPITPRLASQHLDRPRCLSRYTKTWLKELRRGWS